MAKFVSGHAHPDNAKDLHAPHPLNGVTEFDKREEDVNDDTGMEQTFSLNNETALFESYGHH